MATTRKFPIGSAEVPVYDGDELIGHITDLSMEVVPEPATGRLTFQVARVDIRRDHAEQLALQATSRTDYDPVREVWTHYCNVMKPRTTTLGPQERTVIRDALKVATVSECKGAIDGCKASAYHMGENPRRRKYNRLTQILKGRSGQGPAPARTTRETIDFFLDIAAKKTSGFSVTGASGASVDPAKLRTAKQEVRDGLEFPGDERVVERATKARQWLAAQGFRVEQDGSTVKFTAPQQ